MKRTLRRHGRLVATVGMVGLLGLISGVGWFVVGARSSARGVTPRHRQAIYAALDAADQRIHMRTQTHEGLLAAVDSLETARSLLATAADLPEVTALQRYLQWRTGEAQYFLGGFEHEVSRYENATRAFDVIQSHAFSLDAIAALDPASLVSRRIRNEGAHQAHSGSALALATIAEYAAPMHNLSRARLEIFHSWRLLKHFGERGYSPRVRGGKRAQDRAILNNDTARYLTLAGDVADDLALVDSALVHFARVDSSRSMADSWSAYGSYLHSRGMAYRIRHRLSGDPDDLDLAFQWLDRALVGREPSRSPAGHARTRLQRAIALRARAGSLADKDLARVELERALVDLEVAWEPLDCERHRRTAGQVLHTKAILLLDLAVLRGGAAAYSRVDSLLTAARELLPANRFMIDGAEIALTQAHCCRVQYEVGGATDQLAAARRWLRQGEDLFTVDQHPSLARRYATEKARLP